MTAGALRSVLLTPNLLGADGVSSLSRQMARALPKPLVVLSLHDHVDGSANLPADIETHGELHGAKGSRGRFMAAAARTPLRCSAATEIVCSHLHLAPAAALLAWRGGRTTIVLCGIEAWVPLRRSEAWVLDRARLLAISEHTVARFKKANPAFASTDVAVCHPGQSGLGPTDGYHVGGPTALIVARMSSSERYKGHDALLDLRPDLLAR